MIDKLVGSRLILRKAQLKDLNSIYNNVWKDKELAKTMFWKTTDNVDDALERLKKTIDYQSDKPMFFVCLKSTDEVIGLAGIKKEKDDTYSEAGLAIARAHQNNGYAKEMLSMLLNYAFNYLHASYFSYYLMSGNEKSLNLALHFNFIYDSQAYETRTHDNKEFLVDRYILSKDGYFKYLEKEVSSLEKSFDNLFSKTQEFSGGIVYHYDDKLTDMYDHNYFTVDSINNSVIDEIIDISKNKKHIKISLDSEYKSLETNYKFSKDTEILMLKDELDTSTFKENRECVIKNFKEDKSIKDDIIKIELLNYEDVYGLDFTNRKINRYINVSINNQELNFFVAYLNNIPVGYSYAYTNNLITVMDDLVVNIDYRKMGIASRIIKEIINYYNTPLYLHADYFDTPKSIYQKMGFKEIKTTYHYLLLKDNSEE